VQKLSHYNCKYFTPSNNNNDNNNSNNNNSNNNNNTKNKNNNNNKLQFQGGHYCSCTNYYINSKSRYLTGLDLAFFEGGGEAMGTGPVYHKK